jgi:hypothetical protein
MVTALLGAADSAAARAELLVLADYKGLSCLHAAARAGSPEIAEALLQAADSASVLAELLRMETRDTESCLHTAARRDSLQTLQVISRRRCRRRRRRRCSRNC